MNALFYNGSNPGEYDLARGSASILRNLRTAFEAKGASSFTEETLEVQRQGLPAFRRSLSATLRGHPFVTESLLVSDSEDAWGLHVTCDVSDSDAAAQIAKILESFTFIED
ncbi:MAG: hypothetical protein GY719_36920 [bacterium]|nr:hypothetical protein [bacterium]